MPRILWLHTSLWTNLQRSVTRAGQIVIVQAVAKGRLVSFVTRDAATGRLVPSGVDGLPERAVSIAETFDALAGRTMSVLAAVEGNSIRVVSARPAQISAAAELEAAVDRVSRKTWTAAEAVARVDASRLQVLLHPRLKSPDHTKPIATGLGVSPGAASGVIVFTPEDAARVKARGSHCILVVAETGPADIQGMKAATGILTARGGMTSHAAVVARIIGRPCVAGVRSLSVDIAEMSCRIGKYVFHAGDRLTIDGSGRQRLSRRAGAHRATDRRRHRHATRLVGRLARGQRPRQRRDLDAIATASSFGAEGIGLARSEHMFFSEERLVALRRLILSEDEDDRRAALTGLVDYQTGDYWRSLRRCGKPVCVRLFDPPLHEFLPRSDEDIDETARSLGSRAR